MSSNNNVDYTGFNYKDFASWAKSSTGKPYKATQSQITADKQPRFDYTTFVAMAKSETVQN